MPQNAKKLSIEESFALLQSWIDEEPTPDDERLFQEFIRSFDSHRPHRPVFTEYYRDVAPICDQNSKTNQGPDVMDSADYEQDESNEEQRQRQILLNQQAIAILDSWKSDDSESPEEQRAVLFELMRSIECERGWFEELFTTSDSQLSPAPYRNASSGQEGIVVAAKHHPDESDEEKRQRQILINQEAIAFLDSLLTDDTETPEEQRAHLFELMRSIDENREGGRKLFTEYLSK